MSALERIMGAPMAAPETPGLRRLRYASLAATFSLAVAVLLVPIIRLGLGAVATGLFFGVAILVTFALVAIYVRVKTHRDEAWLDQFIARDDAR